MYVFTFLCHKFPRLKKAQPLKRDQCPIAFLPVKVRPDVPTVSHSNGAILVLNLMSSIIWS